jgi:hypothetical protein
MCFVWISEQTAIISLYNINWLVFITKTECVYCAVRTGYLKVIRVLYFIWTSKQTAIIPLYNINWLVFITETECVYCAVRTESLNWIRVNLSLQSAYAIDQETVSVDDVVCLWACRDVPSVAAASAARCTTSDLRSNSLTAINSITSLLHLILICHRKYN